MEAKKRAVCTRIAVGGPHCKPVCSEAALAEAGHRPKEGSIEVGPSCTGFSSEDFLQYGCKPPLHYPDKQGGDG